MENQQSNPSEQEAQQVNNIKHDIFEDPAITRALKEDPFLAYIFKWWREILVLVVAVVAVSYVKTRMIETANNSKSESAELFIRVGSELNEYEAALKARQEAEADKIKAGDKDEEAAKKFNEAEGKVKEVKLKLTEALTSLSDTKAPYDETAGIYRGILAVRDGDMAQARGALGEPVIAPKDLSKPATQENLFNEIRALVLARSLLDDDSKLEEGRSILKSLAINGRYVNVAAAIALSRIASTADQRKDALSVLQPIVDTQPEQAPLLDPEISKLKA